MASQMVDTFKCRTPSLGQLKKEEGNYHFQGTFENKKVLIKNILAGNPMCIYNCMCQWYDTENVVPTPRRSEEEEQSDLDPEQLTIITQKDRNMIQARGDSMQKLLANRETLIWLSNTQNLPERWRLDNSISPMNLLLIETAC